jgi:hypothetical protein
MSREFDGLYARVGRPSIPRRLLLRPFVRCTTTWKCTAIV